MRCRQHRAFRGRPCMPQRDAREGVAATTRGLADWPCCNGTRESPRATGQMAQTDRPESARGGGLTALQMKLTFLRDRDEHRAEAFRSASPRLLGRSLPGGRRRSSREMDAVHERLLGTQDDDVCHVRRGLRLGRLLYGYPASLPLDGAPRSSCRTAHARSHFQLGDIKV